MKNSLSLIILVLCMGSVNAQTLRITVEQKTSEGIKPLADTKFEITLNDSIKTEMTSGSDGMLGKFPLDPGTYKLTLHNPAFAPSETKNIVVSEKKMTAITVTCTPAAVNAPSSRKKTGK